jgi:hypothetical protein
MKKTTNLSSEESVNMNSEYDQKTNGDERKISTESNPPEWVREMFQKQQSQIEEILQFMLESKISSVTCTIQQIKKRQKKQYRRQILKKKILFLVFRN